MVALLTIPLLFFSTILFAGELSLCSDGQMDIAGHATFFGADGARTELAIVDDAHSPAGCRVMPLPVGPKDVLAVVPINVKQAPIMGSSLALQGSETNGQFLVSEVIADDAPMPTPSLPLRESVVSQLSWKLFGGEERSRLDAEHRLLCHPGQRVAGAVLESPRGWPGGLPLQLTISARGEGRFGIAVSDDVRSKSGAPLILGSVDLTPLQQEISFAIPYHNDPWTSITLVCPNVEASMELLSVEMRPQQTLRPSSRSAWVWSPSAWLEHPESIWSLQARHELDTIFVTVPTVAGNVRDPQALAMFVQRARERKLAVWAVSGDPHDVLPQNLQALVARLAAYGKYNRNVPADARLAGLQLDIEPYLLPGYALTPDLWRQRYLDTVLAARASLDPMLPLDLVMPVWWGAHPQWGRLLLDPIDAPGISLTVMNYRTDEFQLFDGAIPFLEWGSRTRHTVRMALEAGPLSNETQRHYRSAADAGDLWLVNAGDQPLLLLLSATTKGLPGRAYRFTHSTPVPATNYTFSGNLHRLEAVTRDLIPVWTAWPSFAGIALHGIDASP